MVSVEAGYDVLVQLGNSDLMVSSVAMGCWPIAGMTSLDVNRQDSLSTLKAALDQGINFFDTAFCYGSDGISEQLLGQAIATTTSRDKVVVATKCGVHWAANGAKIVDGSAKTLNHQCHTSLQRMKLEHVELMYLHRPDPSIPLSESAEALARLQKQGESSVRWCVQCDARPIGAVS